MSWRLDMDSPEERDAVRDEVRRLEPWYHSFRLADWLVIDGEHDSESIQRGLDRLGFPLDFSGQEVLDVGSNAGFYSLLAMSRGATRVVGVEIAPRFIEQAKLISRLLAIDIEFIQADVHEVGPALGSFDTVICSGLMYHIADPTNVLLALASVCRGTLLIESEFLLDPTVSDMARFIEGEYLGDQSNWWIYGPRCMEGMVRATGFRHAEFKGFYREPHGQVSVEGVPKGGRGLLIATK